MTIGLLLLIATLQTQLLFLFLIALFLVGAPSIPKIWKHQTNYFDRRQSWWIWGDVSWRAAVRCLIPFWILGVIVFFPGAMFSLLGNIDSGTAPLWYTAIAGTSFFLFPVVVVLVGGFGRPKKVIPPHLRDQPGAFAEWHASYRKKRADRH